MKSTPSLSPSVSLICCATTIFFSMFSNTILKSLITSYEKAPSEELASAIKKVAEIEDNRILRRNYLTEEKNSSYFSEEIELLKEYYSTFEKLQKKINNF